MVSVHFDLLLHLYRVKKTSEIVIVYICFKKGIGVFFKKLGSGHRTKSFLI